MKNAFDLIAIEAGSGGLSIVKRVSASWQYAVALLRYVLSGILSGDTNESEKIDFENTVAIHPTSSGELAA